MLEDPNAHYRFYFQTLSGHEYYLDIGLVDFNNGFFVNAKPYSRLVQPHIHFVPGFLDGDIDKKDDSDSKMFTPHLRCSALPDLRAQNLVQHTNLSTESFRREYSAHICAIMDELPEGQCLDLDKDNMLKKFFPHAVETVRLNMEERECMRFPKVPYV